MKRKHKSIELKWSNYTSINKQIPRQDKLVAHA